MTGVFDSSLIMATTALDKIPETIASRSQVFEFKTISSRAIGDQLKKIAVADGITVSDEAIALVARAAEGSMRDAETAFDQVLAFAGNTVTAEDVATVLGLVGRDLLFDVLTAVADENGAAAFDLAGRAVEAGYDLKLLCRELARLVRDLLILSIDSSRFADSDIAPEQDHEKLKALLPRFSREDLLRAFDVLGRAESDIRYAAEPRYHLEMALLRWIHTRKLTPLADLIEQLQGRAPGSPAGPRGGGSALGAPSRSQGPSASSLFSASPASSSSASVAKRLATSPARSSAASPVDPPTRIPAVPAPPAAPRADPPPHAAAVPHAVGSLQETYLEEIRKAHGAFHGSVVQQAQGIDFHPDRVVFRFADSQKFVAERVWDKKDVLEKLALQIFGRKLAVVAEFTGAGLPPAAGRGGSRDADRARQAADLKAEAMNTPTVQAILEIFPAEITDVTEIKKKS